MKRTPMPRRTSPLRSSSTPRRGTGIRPRNAKRKAREFERAYGGKARRDFVASLPCVVCGRFPSDPAHIKGGGAGRKGDADKIVPLCRTHHEDQHFIGIQTFAAMHDLDLPALAAETEKRWQEHQTRAA